MLGKGRSNFKLEKMQMNITLKQRIPQNDITNRNCKENAQLV
jgi:hypothetical protein